MRIDKDHRYDAFVHTLTHGNVELLSLEDCIVIEIRTYLLRASDPNISLKKIALKSIFWLSESHKNGQLQELVTTIGRPIQDIDAIPHWKTVVTRATEKTAFDKQIMKARMSI